MHVVSVWCVYVDGVCMWFVYIVSVWYVYVDSVFVYGV